MEIGLSDPSGLNDGEVLAAGVFYQPPRFVFMDALDGLVVLFGWEGDDLNVDPGIVVGGEQVELLSVRLDDSVCECLLLFHRLQC